MLCALALSAPAQSAVRDFANAVDATIDAARENREQNAAAADIRAIFAKAKESEDDGNVNFCGFYVGMSRADADALVAHYAIKDGEATIQGDPVYSIHFSLKGVRRVTKGGNTYEELCQAVANRVGNLKRKWQDGKEWCELETIDGIRVYMDNAGLTISDTTGSVEKASRQNQINQNRLGQQVAKDLARDMVPIPDQTFCLGKHLVTIAQYHAIMDEDPDEAAKHTGQTEPVRLSYADCALFIRRLNEFQPGCVFRRPAYKEWEAGFGVVSGELPKYKKSNNPQGLSTSDVYEQVSGVKYGEVVDLRGDEWWIHREDSVACKVSSGSVYYTFLHNEHSTAGVRLCTSKSPEMIEAVHRAREEAERIAKEKEELERKAREESERIERERMEAACREKQRIIVPRIISNMKPIPGKNYLMGKYEVTQDEWDAIIGNNPSHFKGGNNPVESVSLIEVLDFLRKLNATPLVLESGLTFRLPSGEEWVFACGAGASGRYCKIVSGAEISRDTVHQVAWYSGNSEDTTHAVGSRTPNAFGMYDMLGNVCELTTEQRAVDMYTGHGGHYYSPEWDCTALYGFDVTSTERDKRLGFRLCAEKK